eukprot:4498815-Pyramimonas_sp.AAC.1
MARKTGAAGRGGAVHPREDLWCNADLRSRGAPAPLPLSILSPLQAGGGPSSSSRRRRCQRLFRSVGGWC